MIGLKGIKNNLGMVFGVVTSLAILILFQNCGGSFKAASTGLSSHFSKSGIEACDKQIVSDYSQNFYKLAKTYNCGDCHDNAGGNPRSFVDQDINKAFDQFSQMGGVATFSQKALSDHQKGYTGEGLKGDINLAKTQWDEAVEDFDQCVTAGGITVTGSVTSEKTTTLFDSSDEVIKVGEEQVLRWDLHGSGFSPQLSGASFSITVSVEENNSGEFEYHIKEPVLVAGSEDIYIENIDILINGSKIGKTTYSFSEQVLSALSRITLSQTTAIFKPVTNEFLKQSDTFSIHFHSLGKDD